MATLPSSSSFTGSSVTEADFKAAITQLRDFLSGILGSAGTQISALQALGAILANRTDTGAVSSFNVTTGMRGRFIRCEQSLTLNLPALASAAEGFSIAVKNDGASGDVTIEPDLSETIDGASNIALAPGESCFLYAMSGAWRSLARSIGGDGELRVVHTYTSSTTWNKPAGLKRVRVRVQAGGGGGGAGGGGTNGGSGGGSGGFGEKLIEAASLGSNETVTVGAAGSSGASNGGSGGQSVFGAHVTCTGGGGGVAGGASLSSNGSATGGDLNISGKNGWAGFPGRCGGFGGDSMLGHGGPGSVGSGTGGPARGYGSGGGGGYSSGNGGAGGAGVVIVEEFY